MIIDLKPNQYRLTRRRSKLDRLLGMCESFYIGCVVAGIVAASVLFVAQGGLS